MSLDVLVLFLVAALTFAVMPGPAIVYVVARTLAGGRRAGLWASLGVHVGGYAHVLAAVAGLAVLLHAVPMLYAALKLAGALYLVWIGIGLIRQTLAGATIEMPRVAAASFRQSVLVEILNPKAALFYLAFLPQFTTQGDAWPVTVQLLVLGVIVNALFSVADLIYVLAADQARSRLAHSTAVQWIKRAGGAILIGLGVNLALSRT